MAARPVTVEARCDLTDMVTTSCAHCTGRDGGEADEQARLAALLATGCLEAQWPGRCSACGEPYDVGTPITRTTGGWRAACCMGDPRG
jgi:hypothetical protein